MTAKKRPVFDFSLCVNCAVCEQACPVSCIRLNVKSAMDDKNLYPSVSDGCIGCGSCKTACPVSAVTLKEV